MLKENNFGFDVLEYKAKYETKWTQEELSFPVYALALNFQST